MEFVIEQIILWMDTFRYSTNLEVQERAVGFHQMFLNIQHKIHETSIPEPRQYQDEATESWDSSRPQTQLPCLSELAALFGDIELNPVGAKAQRKVPIPEGLDLETPLYTSQQYISWPNDNLDEKDVPKTRVTADPVTSERRRQEHLERVRDDPFYILGDNQRAISRADTPISGEEDFDSIPIVQFDGGTNLLTPVTTKVRKKKRKPREIILDEPPVDIAVDEMPENAALSDTEVNGRKEVGKTVKNVLSNKQAKGLEDIDFEEEERLEREAIEADRLARENRLQNVKTHEVVEEPLVVERVRKKKKKKEGTREGTKKSKKKDKEVA